MEEWSHTQSFRLVCIDIVYRFNSYGIRSSLFQSAFGFSGIRCQDMGRSHISKFHPIGSGTIIEGD